MTNKSSETWSAGDVTQLIQSRGGGAGLWKLQGSIIALATGRHLANIKGVEEVKVQRHLQRKPKSKETTKKISLTDDMTSDNNSSSKTKLKPQKQMTHEAIMNVRTTMTYTNPETNNILREFRFRPTSPAHAVNPILPKSQQVFIQRYDDGSVDMSTLENRHTQLNKVCTSRNLFHYSWQFIGRRIKSHGNVFTPAVIEFYNYVIGGNSGKVSWNWSRIGKCPMWYGRGQCVMYLNAEKVNKWSDIDDSVTTVMRTQGRQPITAETGGTSSKSPQKLHGRTTHRDGDDNGVTLEDNKVKRSGDDGTRSTKVASLDSNSEEAGRKKRRKWILGLL